MNKPFKSIDDQYNLLLSRGMSFSNENIAKTYLLRNNYYNILNCYGKFFIDDSDNYTTGTNFDEITYVYYFDKEFKSILFKSILEAEKHLKSIISYYFSEAHNNRLLGYKCKRNIPFLPSLHTAHNIQSNAPRQDVYNVFLSLQCLLTKNQYAIMHNSIRVRSRTLNRSLTTIPCGDILESLGFPRDWCNIGKLKQD